MGPKCGVDNCENLAHVCKHKNKIYSYPCQKHRYSIEVRREYYKRAYKKRKKSEKDWWKKQKARIYTRLIFKKVNTCEVDGCNKNGQRHHIDYEKYLDIKWLCSEHHSQLHQNM